MAECPAWEQLNTTEYPDKHRDTGGAFCWVDSNRVSKSAHRPLTQKTVFAERMTFPTIPAAPKVSSHLCPLYKLLWGLSGDCREGSP